MCQKWEGDCGLWVLNEIIFKKYAESLKKIVGAVCHCQCDYSMMFLANSNVHSNFILQISHAKTFKMRYTKCPLNNFTQRCSSKCWKITFHEQT